MLNKNSALVLEGGSLRALFTAGVLDVMMENGIEYPYVNGVSAGSMCAMNFVSGQIRRTRDVNINYLNDRHYIGIRNLLFHGGIFNFDYLFNVISKDYIPFDWDAFRASPTRYVAVATNCRTGEPNYFEKGTFKKIEDAASASCSMPILSKMITLNGDRYLDGGVSMPIAYDEAMAEGYQKIVVVLTREHGYRKKPLSQRRMNLFAKAYGDYPFLLEKLIHVPDHYNQMQEEMDELEKEGKIYIIRPQSPVKVLRVERDPRKLEALYEEGRRVMEQQLDGLKRYLELSE